MISALEGGRQVTVKPELANRIAQVLDVRTSLLFDDPVTESNAMRRAQQHGPIST